MPSFSQCIENLKAQRKITASRGREYENIYNQKRNAYRNAGDPDPDGRAAAETLDAAEADLKHARREVFRNAEWRQRVDRLAEPNLKGEVDVAQTLHSYVLQIAKKGEMIFAEWTGTGGLADIFREIQTFSAGVRARAKRDAALFDAILKEIYGEDGGDAFAKQAAGKLAEVFETARVRFNEAGGVLRKLDRYFPVLHSPAHVVNAVKTLRRRGQAPTASSNKEAWKAFVTPRLNRDLMLNHATGVPLSDGELSALLDDVFDAIVTDGWATRAPQMRAQGSSLRLSRADPRILHWKDGAAHLEYQRMFGEGDVFDSVMVYLRNMARDVALMENLTSNPRAGAAYLKQRIRQQRAQRALGKPSAFPTRNSIGAPFGDNGVNYANGKIDAIDNAMDVLMGAASAPINVPATNLLSLARGVAMPGILKFATALAATTDPMAANHARAAFRIKRVVGAMGYLRSLNPKDPAVQRAAREALVVNQAWMHSMGENIRMIGEQAYVGWGRKWTDFWLKPMKAHTQAMANGLELDFDMTLPSRLGTDWADLPGPYRDLLMVHGRITREDWAVLRLVKPRAMAEWGVDALGPRELVEVAKARRAIDTAPPGDRAARVRDFEALVDAGSSGLSPIAIGDQTWRNLAERLYYARAEFSEIGTPQGRLRSRAALGSARLTPGSPIAIGGSILAELKTFVLSVSQGLGYEVFRRAYRNGAFSPGRAAASALPYFASAYVMLTVGAMFYIQLRHLMNGEDVEPLWTGDTGEGLPGMDVNADLWTRASLTSGSLGFWEFLVRGQTENQYQENWFNGLVGPTVTFSEKTAGLARALGGDVVELMSRFVDAATPVERDEIRELETAKKLVDYARRYNPAPLGLSTLMDRMVFEQLYVLLGGEPAEDAMDDLNDRAESNGRPLWWQHGAALPERAPEFAEPVE